MEHATEPPVRWNSTQVSQFLLPYLRFCDAERSNDISEKQLDILRRDMLAAFAACPDAYRQLHRVYTHADDDVFQTWFRDIDCDDALLDAAFTMIEHSLQTSLPTTQRAPSEEIAPSSFSQSPSRQSNAPSPTAAPRRAVSLGEDASCRALFVISRTQKAEETGEIHVRRVDLLVPFLELCRCQSDAERVEKETTCRRALQIYQNDYRRALAQYREQYPAKNDTAALLPETVLCMQLLEQMLTRCTYEEELDQRRAALQYERGGLGWFRRARKREIDDALSRLDIEEIEWKIADEKERLQALSAPLRERLEAMEDELAAAPVTAFGRKKELRLAIKQTQQALKELREQSELESMIAQRDALMKKKR